jgi:hypothetical protein
MTNFKPDIKEIEIYTVYGKLLKVLVVPNTVATTEAIRTKYIEEKSIKTQERQNSNIIETLKETLKKMNKSKESMIDEVLMYRETDFIIEAEQMIDKDNPDYKIKLMEKTKQLQEEEKKVLEKKSISDVREQYVELRLSLQENLEILSKTYSIMIYNCVRLADSPKKKAFDSLESIDDELTEETKQLLISEHNRINTDRQEIDAKN